MNEFQLDHRRFKVLNVGSPLGETDIAALEGKLATRLPPQLRNYYLHWNGGLPYPLDVPDHEAVCVRLRWNKEVEAARFGSVADLNDLFLVSAGPARDFLRTWSDFRHRIPGDCLCFARNSGGSLFLIGIQQDNLGRIYFWERSHEANIEAGETPSYDNVADVADSFKDFLMALREEPGTGESFDAWVQRVYGE